MVIILKPQAPQEFILERERGTERPSVFVYRTLTPDELADVVDSTASTRGGEIIFHHAKAALKVLRLALIGWRDVMDENGVEVPFPGADEAIAMLSEEDRTEIAQAIRFGSEVTADEGE